MTHTLDETEMDYRDWLLREHDRLNGRPIGILLREAFNAGANRLLIDSDALEAASQRALKLLKEYGVNAP